uniref:60S ribosomal protein L32-1-like n=2 Tax=Rhizophora mucronata TaxID=61149 RepID=A0A2P2KET1_RHIMU
MVQFAGEAKTKMAVPLLSKRIVKKRVKEFKRPQSDRKIAVKQSGDSQTGVGQRELILESVESSKDVL